MRHHGLHEPGRQPPAAVGFDHEDVGEVAEGGEIRDDAGEADLARPVVETETEGVLDRTVHDLPRDALRPVGAEQEVVDRAAVELLLIRGDREAVPLPPHGQASSLAPRIWAASTTRTPDAGFSTAPTSAAIICCRVTG